MLYFAGWRLFSVSQSSRSQQTLPSSRGRHHVLHWSTKIQYHAAISWTLPTCSHLYQSERRKVVPHQAASQMKFKQLLSSKLRWRSSLTASLFSIYFSKFFYRKKAVFRFEISSFSSLRSFGILMRCLNHIGRPKYGLKSMYM